jgi:uncharacterized protein YbjT (DUF2867 family)
MHIAVLAAAGNTGRLLVEQALKRGHEVTAIVRSPNHAALPADPRLHLVVADATDVESLIPAVKGVDAVVSGLGSGKGSPPDLMRSAARAVSTAAGTTDGVRIVWLGAFGTGRSADRAGLLLKGILRAALAKELPDRAAADDIMLAAGATVMHANRLTDGDLSPTRRTVALQDSPRQLLLPSVSRATVAAAMLDEAENPHHSGGIALPLP